MNNLLPANLRVAIVLTTLDLGGAERQALHVASYLQDECGTRVAIVGLFGGLGEQPVRRMCVERRLACLRVNMPEHTAGVPTFRSIRQFARDLAFFQPDVLLPYTSLPNVLCGVVWQKVGAKACIWNQRDEGHELPTSRWQNLALKNAGHFISNSRGGADFLISERGVPREKLDLILNGVDLPSPKQSVKQVRERFGLLASDIVAVMLANVSQFKDHRTLVHAWRIVCDRLPDEKPVLLLAGREDDAGETRRLIASMGLVPQVRIIGPVADVSSLLHAVDFSVLSSPSEGTPNAVLESMAAGRAVVATDIPGCRDALGEAYPALAPPRNAHALADEIVKLVSDRVERTRLGTLLEDRARNEFSIERMCVRTCETIRTLL